MRSSFAIVQNESVASERTVFGIPFRNADNGLYSGVGTFTRTTATTPLGDLHANWEVETFSEGGGWVQAAANAIEDGNSGHVRYVFSQPETNFAGRIAVRFSKLGYATCYCWVTIIPASLTPVSTADLVAYLGVIRTGTCQAGAGSTEVALDAGAPTGTTFGVGMVVYLPTGTGAFQERMMISYDGATKRATVDRAWDVLPDATTTFLIVSGRHSPFGSARNIFDTHVENTRSFAEIVRLLTGIIAGTVEDFDTDTLTFMSLDGSKVRHVVVTVEQGRDSATPGDLSGP